MSTSEDSAGYIVKDFGGDLGRALVATRPFELGELILADPALIVMNRDRDENAPSKLERVVKAVSAVHPEVELPVDLTVNILLKFAERAQQPDSSDFLKSIQTFAKPDVSQHVTWLNPISDDVAKKVKLFLPEQFNALSEQNISDILMVCATNAHSFEDEAGRYVGLYPLGSKLAHSCQPNALQTFDGTTLVHFALKPIEADQMIAINYGFAEDIRSVFPTPLRRARLEVSKFFKCRCERCTAPDTNRILKCPKCGVDAVVKHDFEDDGAGEESAKDKDALPTPSEPTPTHPYICQSCSSIFQPSHLPLHAEQELAESLGQLADLLMTPDSEIDRNALYGAIEKCLQTSDATLGKEHWISGWSVLLLLSDTRGRPLLKKPRKSDAEWKKKRKELAGRWYTWSRRHVFPYFPHYFARLLCSELSEELEEADWIEMVRDEKLGDVEKYVVREFVGPVFEEGRLEVVRGKLEAAKKALESENESGKKK